MKRKHPRFGRGFQVLMGNRRVQAAQMTIAPGDSEGGPRNRHGGADQWLFVVSGRGTAVIKGRSYTLNFYSPPAYTADGDELPAARPSGR